jgi:hypothetical protein
MACLSLLGCSSLVDRGQTSAVLPTVTPKVEAPATAEPTPTATQEAPTPTPAGPVEVTAAPITLAGPITQRSSQLSGLAWYGDYLILLPQFPDFVTQDGAGVIFALPKADLLAAVDGVRSEPLEPLQIPFFAPNIASLTPGYQGFEAIGFDGNEVYLTVEAETSRAVTGYLFHGTMAADLSGLAVDTSFWATIPAQTAISNKSEEALLVAPDAVVTIYEVNGRGVNPAPVAHRIDRGLQMLAPASFPAIEYRITDATALDGSGNFWAINYFFPSDTELALDGDDELAVTYGKGPTHSAFPQVERLVKFHYDGSAITRTEAAPIQLQLTLFAHNWEGIARLDDRGFLLVTDTFPETQLVFVQRP